jgi:hypothetical protein
MSALDTELRRFVRDYIDVRIDACLTMSGRQKYAVRISDDGNWYRGNTLLQAIRAARKALKERT